MTTSAPDRTHTHSLTTGEQHAGISWPLALWLPLVVYFAHYILRVVLSDAAWERWVLGELGATEMLTLVVLLLALAAGIAIVRETVRRNESRLAIFFGVFCLGCLYFAGEEASWGQHLFGWSTPQSWSVLNHQHETNLHNLTGTVGSLLNNGPRIIMTWAILIGGGILPLLRRRRGTDYQPGSFAWWIMPRMVCVPAALVAGLATIPEKIARNLTDQIPRVLDITAGEVKELMIGVFLLLYIVDVLLRLRARRGARA